MCSGTRTPCVHLCLGQRQWYALARQRAALAAGMCVWQGMGPVFGEAGNARTIPSGAVASNSGPLGMLSARNASARPSILKEQQWVSQKVKADM